MTSTGTGRMKYKTMYGLLLCLFQPWPTNDLCLILLSFVAILYVCVMRAILYIEGGDDGKGQLAGGGGTTRTRARMYLTKKLDITCERARELHKGDTANNRHS